MGVVIRKYEKEDHEQVCKLFYNGIVENWLPAYRMTINMKSPIPTVIQLVQLAILYQYLATFLNFLLAQFFIQALVMFGYFTLYWSYVWEHLNSDMRDKELSYWTCRGVQTAGFFVATIDDEVVGTVSYTKEDDHLEINRLSVDNNHRKSGIAAAL